MLDCMKEWRCCTDQKTEYRTAQAAMRVVEVFMVELVKGEYSLYAGVGDVDEELFLGPRVRGVAASVDLTIDGESPVLVASCLLCCLIECWGTLPSSSPCQAM